MLGLTLARSDWSNRKPLLGGCSSLCWPGLQTHKEWRMKGESTLFPGASLSPAVCDNPVFMPEGLDGHHDDASAHVPRCHSQIATQSLGCTHFQSHSTHALSFFFPKLFYTPYVHFGWDSKDCLVSWKQKEKKGENRLFFFSLHDLSVSQANGNA